jgi:hypothetical protein
MKKRSSGQGRSRNPPRKKSPAPKAKVARRPAAKKRAARAPARRGAAGGISVASFDRCPSCDRKIFAGASCPWCD